MSVFQRNRLPIGIQYDIVSHHMLCLLYFDLRQLVRSNNFNCCIPPTNHMTQFFCFLFWSASVFRRQQTNCPNKWFSQSNLLNILCSLTFKKEKKIFNNRLWRLRHSPAQLKRNETDKQIQYVEKKTSPFVYFRVCDHCFLRISQKLSWKLLISKIALQVHIFHKKNTTISINSEPHSDSVTLIWTFCWQIFVDLASAELGCRHYR